eukprot:scaffold2829_cov147-Amphora_coffeaeformis.AAC.5
MDGSIVFDDAFYVPGRGHFARTRTDSNRHNNPIFRKSATETKVRPSRLPFIFSSESSTSLSKATSTPRINKDHRSLYYIRYH